MSKQITELRESLGLINQLSRERDDAHRSVYRLTARNECLQEEVKFATERLDEARRQRDEANRTIKRLRDISAVDLLAEIVEFTVASDVPFRTRTLLDHVAVPRTRMTKYLTSLETSGLIEHEMGEFGEGYLWSKGWRLRKAT